MTTKKSRVAIWKNRARSFQRDVGALLANWRCVLVRHCATDKRRRSVRLFSAWMTMIWTLRIRSRRLSSGERVGRAKVPVETLVMTERSAMSAMTAAKAMRRRLVMTVLRRTLEMAPLTVEVVEDDMGEWRRRGRGGGAAETGKGRGRGGGRTTGAGRERGGGWRRRVRRKGRRCRYQRQNKQRYAKMQEDGMILEMTVLVLHRFLPSCPSWSISVRQISTTTWCLKLFFTTDVASLAQLPNAHA